MGVSFSQEAGMYMASVFDFLSPKPTCMISPNRLRCYFYLVGCEFDILVAIEKGTAQSWTKSGPRNLISVPLVSSGFRWRRSLPLELLLW